MPVEGGTSTVGIPDTGKPKGSGLNAWAQSLANALDIPLDKAVALITGYRAEHGGTIAHAAKAVAGEASADTGGSGGGSSSSSGGSGGSTGPSPESIRNAVASYENTLQGWGIPITPKLRLLIGSLVQGGEGSSFILQAIRGTKAYARRFPGLLKPNGTMRMSESQYISGYNAARDYAHSIGRELTLPAYATALKNGNSPSELKAKLDALDNLKSYRGQLESFNEYLLARGTIQKPLTKGDVLTFIMGEGPRQFEQEWDTAARTAQLARLGIDVGKPKTGSDLSFKELEGLGQYLGPDGEPDYKAILEGLSAIPASTLYGYGLNRKMITELGYGGPNAKGIAETATRALVQYETAVTQPGVAQPQLVQSQSGTQVLGGRRPTQSTE